MRAKQTCADILSGLALLVWIILSGCNSTAQPTSQELERPTSPAPQSTTSQDSKIKDAPGELIWIGKSGGIEIRWTTTELYTQSGSESERIWAPLVQKGFNDFVDLIIGNRSDKESLERCSYERRLKVLSIVGALVSFGIST